MSNEPVPTHGQQIAEIPWIKALRPVEDPRLDYISRRSDLQVWHVACQFNIWHIPSELETRWKNKTLNSHENWQKRPLLISEDESCKYSCGEFELAVRLQNAGFDAYWVSEWSGFPYVPMWQKYTVKRNNLRSLQPNIWVFDNNLRTSARKHGIELGKSGGHPDIAVRNSDGQLCFIEYKGPGDSLKPKQIDWAQAISLEYPGEIRYVLVLGLPT